MNKIDLRDDKFWETKLQQLKKILYIIIICVFSLRAINYLTDTDTLWHIKTGEYIIKNKCIPNKDVFSWIPNLEWQAHESLWDIIVYFVYSLISAKGLMIFRVVLCCTVILIGVYYNRKELSLKYTCYCCLFLTVFQVSASGRPDNISTILLLLNTLYYIKTDYINSTVQDFKEFNNLNKGYFITFPIICFLCAWFHGGYIITLILTMCTNLIVDILRIKIDRIKPVLARLIVIGLGILSGCLNPLGWNIYFYGLKQPDIVYSLQIGWEPFEFDSKVLIIMFITQILCLAFSDIKTLDRYTLRKAICVCFWSCALIVFKRCEVQYTPIILAVNYEFINNASSSISEYIKPIEKHFKRFAGVVLCVSTVILYYGFSNKIEYCNEETHISKCSQGVIEFLRENSIKNYFNDFGDGSYLIWNDIKTFQDPRTDPFVAETSNTNSYIDSSMLKCNYYSYNYTMLEKRQMIYEFIQKYKLEYFICMYNVQGNTWLNMYLDNPDIFELVYVDDSKYVDYNIVAYGNIKTNNSSDSNHYHGYVFKVNQEAVQECLREVN